MCRLLAAANFRESLLKVCRHLFFLFDHQLFDGCYPKVDPMTVRFSPHRRHAASLHAHSQILPTYLLFICERILLKFGIAVRR